MMSRIACLLITAGIVWLLVPPAQAAACVSREEAARLCEAREVVCANVAVSRVRREYDVSEVLDVCLTEGGAPVYIVSVLLDSGERRDVRVDARTGALR